MAGQEKDCLRASNVWQAAGSPSAACLDYTHGGETIATLAARDLVVAGSVDYLITTQVEERQPGFRNGHSCEGGLAIVAAGLKVKSGCRVDEMQNENGRE